MTFRKKIPSLCAGCHPAEYQIYSRSIHGLEFIEKGSIWPAVCDDCHEEHLVPAPKEEKWKLWLISECGSCHRRQLDTYRATYHGKVSELGYGTVAKCSDCHGAHGILPLDNPNSTLAGVNILGTCRKCHPKARGNFTKYYAHPDKHNPKKYPQLYYTNLFMVVLLVGVFCFFIPHTLLWVYRSLKDRIEREGM